MTEFLQRPTVSPSSRQVTPASSSRLHTGPRGSAYLRAIGKLDSSVASAELGPILDDIRREFDEKWAAVPLGLVAHCYLGHPYETHTLALDGHIVEHFEHGRRLPAELDRARSAAGTERYAVIEVYLDKLICVRADGTTVTMEG